MIQCDFTATETGVKFDGDVTYILSWQGFIYVATVIGCYSTRVAGWAIASHMRAELVEKSEKYVLRGGRRL